MRNIAVTLLSLMTINLSAHASHNQFNVDLNEQARVGDQTVITYKLLAVARCLCNASILVKSDSGQEGYVLNSQIVSSITVLVQDREVVLKNPPAGIRDYYAGLESDSWVKDELDKMGIKLADNDSVELISFTGSVVLYAGPDGTAPISN